VQKQKSTILIQATLRLETRIGYICDTHGYQGEVCNGLEMKLIQPSGGIQQAGAPETAAKSVAPIAFTCGSLITKGQIQVCIRLKAEVE